MKVVDQGGDPNRRACLETNEELRKNRRSFALPDHSGHLAFQMPQMDYWYWTSVFPELGASDPQIAKKAWLKFLNTEKGRIYKVNPHEGRKTLLNDGVIIR